MLPNIDILTKEIVEPNYPNKTYKIEEGTKVVFTDGGELVGEDVLVIDNLPDGTDEVSLELTSNDKTVNVSEATVQKYGKNLLPITREISFPADANFSVNCNIKAPFTTTVLIDVTKGATTPAAAFIRYTYSDGTVSYYTAIGWALDKTSGLVKRAALIDNGKTVVNVSYLNWCNLEGTIKEMQIESGKTATEFEPYAGHETYTADENGKVEKVTIFRPTTTLITDNGITIKAKYKVKQQVPAVRCTNSIDGLDAIKQSIFLILSTERYKFNIYSWNYGIELLDLFGEPMSYVMASLPRRIKEALLQDDRITDVIDFEFNKQGTRLYTTFTVVTNIGNISTALEVNV